MISLRGDIGSSHSLRFQARADFFASDPVSVRELDGTIQDIDAIVVLVHGVSNGPEPGYGRFEERARALWPEALARTVFVRLFWGEQSGVGWSTVIDTRPAQVYGMYAMAWSGTAKLADAIGRVQSVLGPQLPVCVVAHSQGCAVTLAALQEGLQIDNLIMMGSPLNKDVVDEKKSNTRLDDAFKKVRGEVINCSSTEDGFALLGSVASTLGAAASSFSPIGRHGLPRRLTARDDVYNLSLSSVDHSGADGWWSAGWLRSAALAEWRGVGTETFARVLASRNRPASLIRLRPRQQRVLSAHVDHVHRDTRKGWYGDNDRNRFSETVFIPVGSRVCWHYDDCDWGSYRVTVRSGAIRLRLREAVYQSWGRASSWKRASEGETISDRLETDGIEDATYRLEIVNEGDAPAELVLTFAAVDE